MAQLGDIRVGITGDLEGTTAGVAGALGGTTASVTGALGGTTRCHKCPGGTTTSDVSSKVDARS